MINGSKRSMVEPEEPEVKRKRINKNTSENADKFNQNNKFKKHSKNVNPENKGKFSPKTWKSNKPFSNDRQRHVTQEKPNWNKLKKEKKELRLKRKQNKGLFDISIEAKKIAEVLRQKELKGGKTERNKLVNQLHTLLGGKGHYAKFVLTHDMARTVQYLLKFGSENIRNDVAKELIPISVEMLQSKYGRYCLKNMLKYGNNDTRAACIKTMYGNAVKLTSHTVSAAVFEYVYSTWATPQQKHHLIQEFFGDIYKRTKDDHVKHLRDVYKDSPNMKNAALQSTKANLSSILNKDLLDSGLIQSVLCQYLSECSAEDKNELIGQLSPHVVVLSNSKDGARVAMQCIWYGTNKDRKIAMKAIKEHVNELSKHEHGHCSVIALLDAADDTVLVNKMLLSQILSDIEGLVGNEWGRKVLLWLVAPGESLHFHPIFIKELETGRQTSTSKKEPEIRRSELLNYTVPSLLENIENNPQFWLSTASIAMLTLAILKSDSTSNTQMALEKIADTITQVDWKINEDDKEITGIEHSGLHMMLKKLAQHDKLVSIADKPTFGAALLKAISDETIKLWLTLNRGCFLLVTVYENGIKSVQKGLELKLKSHVEFLGQQTSTGAKILLKKIS